MINDRPSSVDHLEWRHAGTSRLANSLFGGRKKAITKHIEHLFSIFFTCRLSEKRLALSYHFNEELRKFLNFSTKNFDVLVEIRPVFVEPKLRYLLVWDVWNTPS